MDYAVMDKSSSRALFCALLLLAVVLLTSTRVQSQSPIELFGEAADCAPRIAACSKPTSRSSLLANTTRLPDECICANEVIDTMLYSTNSHESTVLLLADSVEVNNFIFIVSVTTRNIVLL